MGLFEKTFDWRENLSEQEVSEAIAAAEEMVHRDRFAIGFQPDAVKKGIRERKTALKLLKTKKKLTISEVDLVYNCLRKEAAARQSMGQSRAELSALNELISALYKCLWEKRSGGA